MWQALTLHVPARSCFRRKPLKTILKRNRTARELEQNKLPLPVARDHFCGVLQQQVSAHISRYDLKKFAV